MSDYTHCVHGVPLEQRCWQCMDDSLAGEMGRKVRLSHKEAVEELLREVTQGDQP